MLAAIVVGGLIAGCGSSTPSGAATVAGPARANGIHLQRIGVFSQPVYLGAAPGDPNRLFVVERAGRIVVLLRGHRQARPFLDISGEVNSGGGEQGLLSVAFAPDYAASGRLYVYYTDGSNNLRIVQFRRAQGDPNLAEAASARTVLTINHHTETNHNGGQLQFGPDGKLYIGMGDGGAGGDPNNNGQTFDRKLAKLWKLDVDATDPEPVLVAYGLRNPWRFSFDTKTGDLWIGDVGQNLYEEIDRAPATNGRDAGKGVNFGWNRLEGDHAYRGSAPNDADPPVYEIPHDTGACAVVGGFVYRGTKIRGLDGTYLFSDNCDGTIRLLVRDGNAFTMQDAGIKTSAVSSFGQANDGTLYVASLSDGIYRIDKG